MATRPEGFGDLPLDEYQSILAPQKRRSRGRLLLACSCAAVLGVLGGLIAADPGKRAWQPVDPHRESRTFEEAMAFLDHPVSDLQYEQGLHRVLALIRQGIAIESKIARSRTDRLGVQATLGLGNIARSIVQELEAIERETPHAHYAKRKLDQIRGLEAVREADPAAGSTPAKPTEPPAVTDR